VSVSPINSRDLKLTSKENSYSLPSLPKVYSCGEKKHFECSVDSVNACKCVSMFTDVFSLSIIYHGRIALPKVHFDVSYEPDFHRLRRRSGTEIVQSTNWRKPTAGSPGLVWACTTA
jgi:hypothetical protein